MNRDLVPVRRALLSVSDKRNLIDLARRLANLNIAMLASGGTKIVLREAGIPVVEVSDYTGQPEILGGRVKTLHPKLHAGILARRDVPDDLATIAAAAIEPIDLVVVNLYPFEQTVAGPSVSFEAAIEQIDIGGPSLIRGAAKNHNHVAVLTNPDQYAPLLDELEKEGGTTLATRRKLAAAVFSMMAQYDGAIASYFQKNLNASEQIATGSSGGTDGAAGDRVFPDHLTLEYDLRSSLRYGENPHQRACFYVEPIASGANLASARILHGKELSYNNLLDLDNALRLVRAFPEPAAVILKHNNPCGVGTAESLSVAFERAYEGDPVSAFGGIVGLNRVLDLATAERLCLPGRFIEAILAPTYEQEAIKMLTTLPTWKKSVRLLELGSELGPGSLPPHGFDLRRIEGGLLIQDWDTLEQNPSAGTVATERTPSSDELRHLDFAWRVCQAVKSNAIVLAKSGQIVGVGAGQMSRLDSVKIAVAKAGDRAGGSVLASDAFFPFRDGPDTAAAAGVTAIIQPGGSRRDEETIKACNQHQIAMILTGRRHFRH